MYQFIELSSFTRYREDYFSDDQFAELQSFLLENPKVGDVVPATGGVRKAALEPRRHGKTRRGAGRSRPYLVIDRLCQECP